MVKEVKRGNKSLLIVLILLGVLILISIVAGLSLILTGNVTNDNKNVGKEPYQGFEDVEVDLKYEHSGDGKANYGELFNVRYKGTVTIKNVDSETGYFKVIMYFRTLDGTVTRETGGYIQPGEIKEFEIYHDIDLGDDVEFSYNVIPGTKIVTKPVTKYR